MFPFVFASKLTLDKLNSLGQLGLPSTIRSTICRGSVSLQGLLFVCLTGLHSFALSYDENDCVHDGDAQISDFNEHRSVTRGEEKKQKRMNSIVMSQSVCRHDVTILIILGDVIK